MKPLILSLYFFAVSLPISQNPQLVKWQWQLQKMKENEFELYLTAAIAPGWHIYALTQNGSYVVPTTVDFSPNPLITFKGKMTETGTLMIKHEELLGIDLLYYENKMEISQKLGLKASVHTALNGKIHFMACNGQQCTAPQTVPFTVEIK